MRPLRPIIGILTEQNSCDQKYVLSVLKKALIYGDVSNLINITKIFQRNRFSHFLFRYLGNSLQVSGLERIRKQEQFDQKLTKIPETLSRQNKYINFDLQDYPKPIGRFRDFGILVFIELQFQSEYFQCKRLIGKLGFFNSSNSQKSNGKYQQIYWIKILHLCPPS